VPNGVGVATSFNSPTATETVNLNAPITVGTITFTNNGTSLVTLANGTSGALTVDASSGNGRITFGGTNTGTNNITVSASRDP
jgi:hypothetical protein